MRRLKKIVASILLACMCFISVTNDNTIRANEAQINSAGETVEGDNVAVSKTIESTDMENVFDITLRVETQSEIHRMLEQPPMSVVIVLDISNTMFTQPSKNNPQFDDAMEAMKTFITDYAASSQGATVPRELSIVTFNTNAQVQQTMIDLSNSSVTAEAICTSVETKINNLVGDLDEYSDSNIRFTNIEAGLRLAQNILAESSTENQYVILLTDGMPTTYSKNHTNTSTTKITGYNPVMSTAAGTVGEDGVFYDTATGYYCLAGVNYSDVAAQYAEDRAVSIKESGVSIYSVGINIGQKQVSNFVRNNANGVGSTVDYNSGKGIVIESSDSTKYTNAYKNWLYNEIGSQYYADGNDTETMTTAFDEILDIMHETSKEYVVEAWKTADPMNSATSTSENVEFLAFISKNGNYASSLNGSAGVGNENKASFDDATDTIDWMLPESGYSSVSDNNGTRYIYELKYRIRLKNEEAGFVPNVPIETNGETTLSYMVNDNGKVAIKTINYTVPKVVGYLGEFSFKKIDDSGRNISVPGAEFTLTHSDDCTICRQLDTFDESVTIAPMTAISGNDGMVTFTNIPSGHEYVLKETEAPTGFELSNTTYEVSVDYGVVTIDGAAASELIHVVNNTAKYSLNYVIVSDVNPDSEFTDVTPTTVTNIPYNTNKVLAGKLTTTDTDNGAGVIGAWRFTGWYDNEACEGTPIDYINITKDTTVYGGWEFIPNKYIVTYIVNPDPTYGIPRDTVTPIDNTEYNENEAVDIVDALQTTWTTSEGTTLGTDAGVPGVWTFSGWDKTDFNITENTVVTGSWTFVPTPETYTLEYVIVSTDNPRSDRTDATPAKVENIIYNEDRVLEAALTTRDLMNTSGDYVEWEFLGWYDNEACEGTPIRVINIKENETVYGKWTYTLRNHKVEYMVTGDALYGVPQDTTLPDTREYNYFDTVEVANNQFTAWTTSNGRSDGVPGTWKFSSWDREAGSRFTITADTVIKGSWDFEPATYNLNYVIESSENPDTAMTTATPSQVTGIAHNSKVMLADRLTTTDTTNDAGDTGTWRFSGWYDDEGNKIEVINITQDETVYGRWDFIEGDKYIVTYEVEPDPIYGKPGDAVAPDDMNAYNSGDTVDVANNLTTGWTTTDGTSNGNLGTWEFIPWDKEDGFAITDNTTIRGGWKFTPSEFTLEYVIVTDDNPAAEDTDATPDKVTKIPVGTDKTLALPLETLSNNNDGVPGKWIFQGWYDNEECSGNPISNVANISSDIKVYGKWDFVPMTYDVKYEVIGDPVYGIPSSGPTPTGSTGHAYKDKIDVADNLTTTWTTPDGTPNGIPGSWEFSWDKEDDFEIIEDTIIKGEWKFTPLTYSLEYVIVSKENPTAKDTDATPSKVTGIVPDGDVTLEDSLTTTSVDKNGVKGVWTFYGWYDNEACTGKPIESIENINENKTVYGKWEFVKGEASEDIVSPDLGNNIVVICSLILFVSATALAVFYWTGKRNSLTNTR